MQRTSHPTDRRARLVRLTAAGAALAAQAATTYATVLDLALDHLPPARHRELDDLLTRLAA